MAELTCPSREQIPVSWAAENTTATEASCSIPLCADNHAVMQRCCDQYSTNGTAEVDEFNSDTGVYLTCSISTDYAGFDSYTAENSLYQSYQDCLIDQTEGPLLCNYPRNASDGRPATPLQCSSSGVFLEPPPRIGGGNNGSTVCGLRHSDDAIEALKNCCGDSTLQAYGYGCYASCVGSDDLRSCLADQYQGDGGLACTDAKEAVDTSGANRNRLGVMGWLLVVGSVAGLLQ